MGSFNRYFVVFNFLSEGITVDAKNISRLGLIAFGLVQDNLDKGFFHTADNQIKQMSVLVTIHVAYVFLNGFVQPFFKE